MEPGINFKQLARTKFRVGRLRDDSGRFAGLSSEETRNRFRSLISAAHRADSDVLAVTSSDVTRDPIPGVSNRSRREARGTCSKPIFLAAIV